MLPFISGSSEPPERSAGMLLQRHTHLYTQIARPWLHPGHARAGVALGATSEPLFSPGAREQVAFDAPTQPPPGKISRAETIRSSGNSGRGARGKEKGREIAPKQQGRDAVYGALGFVGREMEE